MNGKEALYKRKTPGLASREVRAKLKTHESRTKRDDLLASKRRIPLCVLQEQSPHQSPIKKKIASKQEQSDLRLVKLKEWKKTREEAKHKAKQNTKKPFGSGLSSASSKPNIFVAKPWKVASPIAKSNDMKPAKSISNSIKPKSVSRPSARIASKPATKPASAPTRPTASKSTQSTVAPKPATAIKTRQSTRPQPAKPASGNKEPKKQPLKAKEDTKPAKRPVTRSMTKSAVSKVKADSKKSYSTKAPKGTKQAKSARKPAERSSPNGRCPRVVTKDTDDAMDITVEISNPAANEEELPPPPVTPTRRYDPVHPSPLLRSTSAKRRETQLYSRSGPRPVTNPAWIPGHDNTENFVQPNFDDAFGTFSPFKFGGSNSTFQFTFRKELSFTSDSLEEMSTDHSSTQFTASPGPRVTPDARIVRRSLGSSHKNSPLRSVSVDEGSAVIVEVVQTSDEMETESGQEQPNQVEDPAIDIGYFRGLHSDVTATLTSLCEVWDGKAASLEEDQPDGASMDEALGQVRTTVCQARLLMRQKLKQYSGLVDTAETQSGERKTTADDLQGFWDMVYCQVEDVYQKFHGLKALEKNGWTKAPTPKKKTTKKRAAKKSKVQSAEESERLQAAREKREAQRNKLKELKMAAKRAREEAACDQENIDCTPKKAKLDSLSPKTGSAYKNGKRRSLRLRNRSVFSPMSTERLSCPGEYSDIPVAPLISFD